MCSESPALRIVEVLENLQSTFTVYSGWVFSESLRGTLPFLNLFMTRIRVILQTVSMVYLFYKADLALQLELSIF